MCCGGGQKVRNPEMSWHDTRKMLHEDHRWRLTKLLDKTEKQRLFDNHVALLNRRNRELFRRVIDEFVSPVELSMIGWRDVRRLIKDDPRFARFSSSDRVRGDVLVSEPVLQLISPKLH